MPAAPGTGIKAGGTVRKVLDLAGVKDILSKAFGTTNKICNARATILALKKMTTTPGMARQAKVIAAKKEAQAKIVAAPAAAKPSPAAHKPAAPAAHKPATKPVAPAAKPQEKSTKSA